MGSLRGDASLSGSAGLGSVLVLTIDVGNGSVSACALAPGACGGDVEQRLRLPQLGPPLQVIHVGCGELCHGACSENKSFVKKKDG